MKEYLKRTYIRNILGIIIVVGSGILRDEKMWFYLFFVAIFLIVNSVDYFLDKYRKKLIIKYNGDPDDSIWDFIGRR